VRRRTSASPRSCLSWLRTSCSASAKVKNWGVGVVTIGLVITGQNPASSGPTAKVLIDTLKAK
jgi:putative intracellular protease/amidase